MVKNFFFFLSQQGERGCVFAVFFAPFQKGISNFIAHGSIIRVFTVYKLSTLSLMNKSTYCTIQSSTAESSEVSFVQAGELSPQPLIKFYEHKEWAF